jgi:hypothetical protein
MYEMRYQCYHHCHVWWYEPELAIKEKTNRPCLILSKEFSNQFMESLRLLPITPMPTPLHSNTLRTTLRLSPIYQLHYFQWSCSRKASAASASNNQNLRRTPTPGPKVLRNRIAPIKRRVISHELPIPSPISLERFSEEKRFIILPLFGALSGISRLRVRSVAQAGSDGADVR